MSFLLAPMPRAALAAKLASVCEAFHSLVRHLVDIGKASTAFGVFNRTLASANFLFRYNSFYNGRFTIHHDILLDVGSGVTEAITNCIFHYLLLQGVTILIRLPNFPP